jgi:hypothetical protein
MNVGIVTTDIPPAKGYGGVSVTDGVLTKAWRERIWRVLKKTGQAHLLQPLTGGVSHD